MTTSMMNGSEKYKIQRKKDRSKCNGEETEAEKDRRVRRGAGEEAIAAASGGR